jgi:hypothetical protein
MKKVIVVCLLAVVVLVCVFVCWGRRPAQKATIPEPPKLIYSEKDVPPEWRGLAALVAARETTSEDWKQLKVEGGIIKGTDIPYGIALNFWPILEAEQNTNARHVSVSSSRLPSGGLSTSIWGRKLNRKVTVDWSEGAVDRSERSTQDGMELSESPTGKAPASKFVTILFGKTESDQNCIAIGITEVATGKADVTLIPYDYQGYSLSSAYATVDYPIAAAIKIRENPHEFAGVVLFDISLSTVIGEIELPPVARDTRGVFALDAKNDVFIATGYNLHWLMAIDLRTYIQKSKTSGPQKEQLP